MHTGEFYINGEWVAPQGTDTIDVINPATEEVVATLPLGTAADADAARRPVPRAAPARIPTRPGTP